VRLRLVVARVAVVLTMAGLLACSASHSVDDAGADAATDATPDAGRADLLLLDEVQRALCAREMECSHWHRPDGMLFPGDACDDWWQGYEHRRVESGQHTVDIDSARECLEGLRTLGGCMVRTEFASPFGSTPGSELADTCERMIRYTPTCGEEVCAEGDVCTTEPTCERHCAHLGGVGAPCGPTDLCLRGLTCDGAFCVETCIPRLCREAGYETCWQNVCASRIPIGEPCPIDYCVEEAICDPEPTRCVEPPPPTGPPPLGEGEACDPSEFQCAYPLTCDPATRLCATWFAAHGSCTENWDCGPSQRCHIIGPVVGPGMSFCSDAVEGSTCRFGHNDFFHLDSCPEGYECTARYLGGQCRRLPALGAACDEAVGCTVGAACVLGRCVAPVLPGQACDDATPCGNQFHCEGAICVADPFIPYELRCEVGQLCDVGTCMEGRCTPLPVGSACGPYDCLNCVDGICAGPTEVDPGGECATNGSTTCVAGTRCTYTSGGAHLCCG
jgi:hypothetical protein